jgi:predicted RNA-binding protein with PUA-like domain
MAYWLMKSEPYEYSWSQLLADGLNRWDGVRNYQARNNLRAMQLGDRAFFYHSNEGREIVGVMEIVKTAYPDPSDETGRFDMVDVKPVMSVVTPVTLATIKADPRLVDFALLRQSRLSVAPVRESEWAMLCAMAGISA